MAIFLMRHGDALDKLVDPKRPLSETGIQQVKQVAEYLNENDYSFEKICHSSKTRAEQTAQLLQSEVSPNAQIFLNHVIEPDLDYHQWLDSLYLYQENAVFVGHLPNIQQVFLGLNIKDSEEKFKVIFEPASIVILEKQQHAEDHTSWSILDYYFPGKWE